MVFFLTQRKVAGLRGFGPSPELLQFLCQPVMRSARRDATFQFADGVSSGNGEHGILACLLGPFLELNTNSILHPLLRKIVLPQKVGLPPRSAEPGLMPG
jgi:hypothetical protein